MTGRDRIVLIGVLTLVVLAAGWLLVVSPEREQASKLATEVSTAQAQLATAESQVTNARQAQSQYATAYASIVSLGKAVPPGQEVPSLIYQLDQASNQKHVEFSSISGGSSAPAGASTATAAATAGFTQMPFTFIFNGGYEDLYHLFQQLDAFTVRTASGGLEVSGRLLTVQSVKLSPVTNSGAEKGAAEKLTGTISATAYVLPASQGLTGGATASSPAGVATSAASTSGATSSSPAPAIVTKVNP
jgi:Tfp pilus assembly protein PilO